MKYADRELLNDKIWIYELLKEFDEQAKIIPKIVIKQFVNA